MVKVQDASSKLATTISLNKEKLLTEKLFQELVKLLCIWKNIVVHLLHHVFWKHSSTILPAILKLISGETAQHATTSILLEKQKQTRQKPLTSVLYLRLKSAKSLKYVRRFYEKLIKKFEATKWVPFVLSKRFRSSGIACWDK